MDELRTTLTNESGDLQPVHIEYEINGWHDIDVRAVRADMPGEKGPDIQDWFDLDEAIYVVCRSIEWKKPKAYPYF